MKEIADEALADAPTVTHTVVWRRLGLDDVPMTIGRDRFWDELVSDTSEGLAPRQVDSEHPYLLAYTSGTTGRPKGALHVQGGFLVSIAREVAYQSDVKPGDRIHFATDMGWIMGPWTVVGGGACGATVVYAEGAPDFPPDRLWKLVESERVTMLGVSPTLVRALIPKGEPEADMSSLKSICTTGRAVEPRSVPLAVRARRRRPRPDRERVGRDGGRGLLPCDGDYRTDQAGRSRLPRARRGHGRVRRLTALRYAAKSASSCASGRGRG